MCYEWPNGLPVGSWIARRGTEIRWFRILMRGQIFLRPLGRGREALRHVEAGARVFELVRMHRIFDTLGTKDEAVRAFANVTETLAEALRVAHEMACCQSVAYNA